MTTAYVVRDTIGQYIRSTSPLLIPPHEESSEVTFCKQIENAFITRNPAFAKSVKISAQYFGQSMDHVLSIVEIIIPY